MDKNSRQGIKKIAVSILEAKGISYDEWLEKLHLEIISENSQLIVGKIEKNKEKKDN